MTERLTPNQAALPSIAVERGAAHLTNAANRERSPDARSGSTRDPHGHPEVVELVTAGRNDNSQQDFPAFRARLTGCRSHREGQYTPNRSPQKVIEVSHPKKSVTLALMLRSERLDMREPEDEFGHV